MNQNPAPILDRNHFAQVTDNDPQKKKELSGIFFSVCGATLDILQKSLSDGDQAAWRGAAHKMKGSAGAVGAVRLHAKCREAEESFEVPLSRKEKILEEIKNLYALTEEEIRKDLAAVVAPLQAGIVQLRTEYLRMLREKMMALRDFERLCAGGSADEEARSRMAALAHKLAGSGATYGFKDISFVAKSLENALDEGEKDYAGLRLLANGLLDACRAALEAKSSPDVPRRGNAPVSGALPRLLVADDDLVIQSLVQMLLKEIAHIETAADGLAALAAIRKGGYDLVLLDDNMPGMKGTEILKEMEGHPCPPVILMTANDSLRGSANFIAKPFAPEAFVEAVRAALKKPS